MGSKIFQAGSLVSDGVFHGFFSRKGGVSTGIYAGLNCGAGSDDDPAAVLANKDIVRDAAGAEALVTLHQVHSAECVVIDAPFAGEPPEADAMVSDQAGIALGVLTADCAPVLFMGEKANGAPVIGAAHAGWGGAFKGVLGASVEAMIGRGAVLSSIRAAIGPCIAQASYEVTYDFAERFIEQDEGHEKFFKAASREGHLMFDLAGYCALRLSQAGVRQVEILDRDTYADEENFFSYRRKTHRDEADYGRQISVVCIKPH
ncbi:MAG: peptidoglycan editing factor PgeF [Alphaproteobacteria bacterium]